MTRTSTLSPVLRALIGAALILAASAALNLASPDHISPELAQRLLGALLGMVVAVYANAVPKALTPLARLKCEPAAEQALRRFTGLALVLGGIGYAAAWLLAPIGSARPLAMVLLAGALSIVVARYSWMVYAGSARR